MQTERCDLKCMIEYGLRYRQSSIRLMCSSVPAMTNLERREKEKELERTKEDREFGARALVRHSRLLSYDKSLLVAYPTIADFMYFMS